MCSSDLIELILIHRTTIAGASPWLIGDVVVIHVTAIAWLMARNVTLRCRVILAVIGVTGVAAAILGLGLSVRSAGLAAGGVCHAAAYSMLLIRFAMSLRPGNSAQPESVTTSRASIVAPHEGQLSVDASVSRPHHGQA